MPERNKSVHFPGTQKLDNFAHLQGNGRMLTYLGSGWRDYFHRPVKKYPRKVWEFQAILKGTIAPVLNEGADPFGESSLWVMPPDLSHGWTSPPETPGEVVVFHFNQVPPQFSWFLSYRPYLCIALGARERGRVRDLALEAKSSVGDLTLAGRLRHARILHEICLLCLRSPVMESLLQDLSPGQKKVEEACEWFARHLEENPRLPEVCRAVGSSPASLRRHFHRVLGVRPVDAFTAIRHREALHLLSTQVKHEEIAYRCGFSSASAFSRAFKSHLGVSPREWQEREGVWPI